MVCFEFPAPKVWCCMRGRATRHQIKVAFTLKGHTKPKTQVGCLHLPNGWTNVLFPNQFGILLPKLFYLDQADFLLSS